MVLSAAEISRLLAVGVNTIPLPAEIEYASFIDGLSAHSVVVGSLYPFAIEMVVFNVLV